MKQKRNNVLYRAIYDVWPSLSAFCRQMRMGTSTNGVICDFINLKAQIWKRRSGKLMGSKLLIGEYRDFCLKLSDILGYSPFELFPPKLYGATNQFGSFSVKEYDLKFLPSGLMLELPAEPEINPAIIYEKKELKNIIVIALGTLSLREKKVLEMRFGMGDDNNLTLNEIGKVLNVTGERINQIGKRAIKKLRHPSRVKIMKSFI